MGEVESIGFEFDVNLDFDNGVSFWVFYVYMDVEFVNSFVDVDGFGFMIDVSDVLINFLEY